MTIVISNKKWFTTYVRIRQIILFLLSLQILFMTMQVEAKMITHIFYPLTTSLLFVLFIFDYWEKPAFFELIEQKNKLLLRLFVPDLRYFLFFQDKYVEEIIFEQGNKIICRPLPTFFSSLLQKYILILQKNDDANIRTTHIYFNWATKIDLERLNRKIVEHNQK